MIQALSGQVIHGVPARAPAKRQTRGLIESDDLSVS
jgi:hypothetical protein